MMNIRTKTKSEMTRKLKKKGKYLLVRPTGFGKTTMMNDLIRKYSKVLYLYPSEVVESTVKEKYWGEDGCVDEIENVTFMTYMKLALYKDFIKTKEEFRGYDLIIADEAHRIGADNTSVGLHNLLEVNPSAKLVGLTATPIRSDDFDIASEFFDNSFSSVYTLEDAIKENLIQKPYYVYCSYDIEKDIKELGINSETKLTDSMVSQILKSKYIEQAESIRNMPTIIRTTCDKYAKDRDYMKFIVFYPSLDAIQKHKEERVGAWFKEAYPEYNIEHITISSETEETRNNVNKLPLYANTHKNKTIVLIHCVDMLNMGYHVPDLTGIIMLRGTHSGIVYAQQLGRALSSGDKEPSIIFDVVDNIHRRSIYDSLSKNGLYSLCCQISALEEKLANTEDEFTKKVLSDKLAMLKQKYDDILLSVDKSSGRDHTRSIDVFRGCNELTPLCLNAVGNEATYRELIAKAVAEPLAESCRRAFKEWREVYVRNNIAENKNALEGYSDGKFLQSVNMDLQTLSMVDKTFKNGDSVPPLEPFASARGVSLQSVLNQLAHDNPELTESDYRVKI